jgi:hypothetical protein
MDPGDKLTFLLVTYPDVPFTAGTYNGVLMFLSKNDCTTFVIRFGKTDHPTKVAIELTDMPSDPVFPQITG